MPWSSPPSAPPPVKPGSDWPKATTTGVSGILAGQVLDNFNRRPPTRVFIQVNESDKETNGAPIEVATDEQGYFTIQGLKAGAHYRLTARLKAGERLWAGTTYATPPNPRVVIRISGDLATSSTPPLPGSPSIPSNLHGKSHSPVRWPWSNNREQAKNSPAKPQPSAAPIPKAPPRPAGLGVPVPAAHIEPSPAPAVRPNTIPVRPEDITRNRGFARREAPAVSIPGRARPKAHWIAADAAAPEHAFARDRVPVTQPVTIRPIEPESRSTSDPAPIPSCVLVGKQLHNLALNDQYGQPWEYRVKRSRLTLIDFWGTWCVYCLHGIPHLNTLQERYGNAGLQVVGIAYEDGPPQVKRDKVKRVKDRLRINYTILMGADRVNCPVRSQFGIASWPTLVLLDESGRIIWRSAGAGPQAMAELEAIIRQRLR